MIVSLTGMETGSLDGAIQLFTAFVRSLPTAEMEPSKRESWGPREVLIHLVFWHEQYAQIASAVARSKKPLLLKGTARALNDAAVAREINAPIDELLRRWTRAHTRFSAVARSPPCFGNPDAVAGGRQGTASRRSHPAGRPPYPQASSEAAEIDVTDEETHPSVAARSD